MFPISNMLCLTWVQGLQGDVVAVHDVNVSSVNAARL